MSCSRRACEGHTRTGRRCAVTSSSEHEHAAPLRQGSLFCAHHVDGDEELANFEIYECEACGELQAVPDGDAIEHDCPASARSEDDEFELYECEDCGEVHAARFGQACEHVCPATGVTSLAMLDEDDPGSDYDPSSGGWGSVEDSGGHCYALESWEYEW